MERENFFEDKNKTKREQVLKRKKKYKTNTILRPEPQCEKRSQGAEHEK